MRSIQQQRATHNIMHNKYPIDTLRLLKSNYKYKRRPPFARTHCAQPTRTNALALLRQQHLRNLHQNVHMQILSLIFQLILMFINLIVQQLRKLTRLIDACARCIHQSSQRMPSVLSYYATQRPAAVQWLSLTFAKWLLCARWFSNFSLLSMLSTLLASLSALNGTPSTKSSQSDTSKRYVMLKFHKGISVNLLVMTLFMALLASIHTAAGGACWKAAMDNGKCSEIFSMNMTRSECCRISSEFSFTERELTSVEYFFATAIGGGMECAPCVESCKSVKCGINKKCVKRKGRPKCICAPDCGAARRRKHQQLHALHEQQHSKRISSNTNAFVKSPRDIRSLSSEINNYNLELDEFSLLLQQQQQQEQQKQEHVAAAVDVDKNQRKMHILQSQSQQKPSHLQKQRRLLVIANVEPTTAGAAKRRLQILSNVEGRAAAGGRRSGGGKRARNKHAENGERRHVGVEKTSPLLEANRRATTSRQFQSESNELPTANTKQRQSEQHNAKRRHRHQQQQQQQELANLRHIENALNNNNNENEEQNQQEFAAIAARKRKHKQQEQRRRHKQHKIKDHMQNSNEQNTTATTSSSNNSTTSAMSTATKANGNLTSLTVATPANSTVSAIDEHLNIVNHGSNFATSSLSVLSAATTTITTTTTVAGTNTRSTLLLSGVDLEDNNENKQDHDHAVSMAPSAIRDANNNMVNSNSVKNNHDMTVLDGIFDQYNQHGFPNQQFSITHSEHFHGSHPVCGTDGRTYHTECQLKKRACRTNNANLQVAYRGYCKSSCHGVKCLHGLTCVEDNYKIPHCISCNIQCPYGDSAAAADGGVGALAQSNELRSHNYQRVLGNNAKHVANDEGSAVCGVDGKTYKSICDINRMVCKIGRAIAVAYPGPCRADVRTCQDINCGPKNTCLVDFLTHQPRCISCRYKCSRKRRPMSLRYEEGKICGVNNRTYNSWCEMRKDSCATGYFIDVRTAGECSGT